MHKKLMLVVAILSISALRCGNEDCFSVGPFGDCADRYPSTNRAGAPGQPTGGEFRAWVEGNVKENGRIEIKTTGGVPPYKYRLFGKGEMQNEQGLPNDNTRRNGRFYHAKNVQAGEDVEIRVTDSSPQEEEIEVWFRVQAARR